MRKSDLRRGSSMLLLFMAPLLVIFIFNPIKAGLALWGLCKLGLGGYVGYWIDRVCFRGDASRPHALQDDSMRAAWLRRAIIVAASILAVAQLP